MSITYPNNARFQLTELPRFLQLSLFCLLELADRSIQHTLFGPRTLQGRSLEHDEQTISAKDSPCSPSSSNETDSNTEDQSKILPHFSRSRSGQILTEHAQWLQRRNSASSQQAVFPAATCDSFHFHSCCGQPSTYPSTLSSPRRTLTRSISNPMVSSLVGSSLSSYTVNTTGMTSTNATHASYVFPSRSASFMSSIYTNAMPPSCQHQSYCGNNHTSPSKHSSGHISLRPPCPISLNTSPPRRSRLKNTTASNIPERFRSTTTCRTATTLRAVSEDDDCEALLEEPNMADVEEDDDDTPESVPSWSAPLRQPKLSEDPIIRMLSGSWSKTMLALGGAPIQSSERVNTVDTTRLARSGTIQTNDTAPTIPERAAGHIGPSLQLQDETMALERGKHQKIMINDGQELAMPQTNTKTALGILSPFPRPPPSAVSPNMKQGSPQAQALTVVKKRQANEHGLSMGDENTYRGVRRGRGLSRKSRDTGEKNAGRDFRGQTRARRGGEKPPTAAGATMGDNRTRTWNTLPR